MLNNDLVCAHCGERRGVHYGFNYGCRTGKNRFKLAPVAEGPPTDREAAHRLLKRLERVLGLYEQPPTHMWSKAELMDAIQMLREQ